VTVRLLVTGFTPFPGAPVNPTEHLIRHFEDNPPLAGDDVACRFAVLPVDYGRAIPALEDVAAGFEPHVAVHFGLAAEARGFRLERLARNEIAARIADNAGNRPEKAKSTPARSMRRPACRSAKSSGRCAPAAMPSNGPTMPAAISATMSSSTPRRACAPASMRR
jgi:hypothetical protein